MDAKDHAVISVLGDQRRFVVPIFQRQYAWRESRLIPFWEDVVAKAEEALGGKPRFSHYMGALILAPGGDGFTIGMTPRVLVIDGQQRLTTFQLFLAALREVGPRFGFDDAGSLVHSYLHVPKMTGDVGPDATFRLIPTPEDRAVFHAIVEKGFAGIKKSYPKFFYQNGRIIKGMAPNAVRAFCFFIDQIERYAKVGAIDEKDAEVPIDADPEAPVARLRALLQALLHHLKLVVITLAEDDDAQVIFETLNSKAEPLLAMDLVRNNIFHRAAARGESVEALFQEKWRPFDQDSDFWKADSPRAKPKRPRIDHFLSHALTAQTGQETSLRELYAEYRAFTRPKGKPRFETVEAELEALVSFTGAYRTLEDAQGADADVAWIGGKLNLWEVSTAYPLVFRIAVSDASPTEKKALYELIYGYLVRRAVCGLTPKSLNKTFARLTLQMIEAGVSLATFHAAFAQQTGDAVRFPDDAEFRHALATRQLYHTLSRKDRLADLLWDLEIASRSKFNVNVARPDSMSVEHIMPQTWTTPHWPLPGGCVVPADRTTGIDSNTLPLIRARDAALHTLGNLTLITVAGNTVASNSAFSAKKQWLSQSLLALNLEVLQAADWDVDQIGKRASALAARAVKAWPSPNAVAM